jgi:hypothetical protein
MRSRRPTGFFRTREASSVARSRCFRYTDQLCSGQYRVGFGGGWSCRCSAAGRRSLPLDVVVQSFTVTPTHTTLAARETKGPPRLAPDRARWRAALGSPARVAPVVLLRRNRPQPATRALTLVRPGATPAAGLGAIEVGKAGWDRRRRQRGRQPGKERAGRWVRPVRRAAGREEAVARERSMELEVPALRRGRQARSALRWHSRRRSRRASCGTRSRGRCSPALAVRAPIARRVPAGSAPSRGARPCGTARRLSCRSRVQSAMPQVVPARAALRAGRIRALSEHSRRPGWSRWCRLRPAMGTRRTPSPT